MVTHAAVFQVGVPTTRASYLANSLATESATPSISIGSLATSDPNSSEMAYATSSVDPVEVPKKIPTLVPKRAVVIEEAGRLAFDGSGENATHTSGTEDTKIAAALRSKSDEELYLIILE